MHAIRLARRIAVVAAEVRPRIASAPDSSRVPLAVRAMFPPRRPLRPEIPNQTRRRDEILAHEQDRCSRSNATTCTHSGYSIT